MTDRSEPGTVRVGDALPDFPVPSIDAGRMAVMAALLDDPVPIHYDVRAVEALGMGDRLVNQGPLAIGYLTELLVRWTGGDATRLQRLRCRLNANVFEGDSVVATGKVTAVDASTRTCTIELALRRGDDVVASGEAKISLAP